MNNGCGCECIGKLQFGDQILAINGQQIEDTKIRVNSGWCPKDKTITFEIQRDGKFRQFIERCWSPRDRNDCKIGMVISCDQEMGWIFISKVDPFGLAEKNDLKVGERIIGINGICLMEATMSDVIDAMRNSIAKDHLGKDYFKILVQQTRTGTFVGRDPKPDSSCLIL